MQQERNAFSRRIAADIERGREDPITLAEMAQLAADHGLAAAEVEELAEAAGFDLRATAEAVRLRLSREGGC